MKKLRILLADDHPVVLEGLKFLIDSQRDLEVTGTARNGREAFQKAKEIKPDVLVLDLSMPEWNGIEVIQRLKREYPELPVMALTVHEEEDYLKTVLKAGASGYVLKRTAADELLHAIRTVARGGVYVSPESAAKLVQDYVRQVPTRTKPPKSVLSEREEEVLRFIAWGYSNKEIASKLGISVKTVETYKTRLMEKLNLSARTDIVRYALQKGWMADGRDADDSSRK